MFPGNFEMNILGFIVELPLLLLISSIFLAKINQAYKVIPRQTLGPRNTASSPDNADMEAQGFEPIVSDLYRNLEEECKKISSSSNEEFIRRIETLISNLEDRAKVLLEHRDQIDKVMKLVRIRSEELYQENINVPVDNNIVPVEKSKQENTDKELSKDISTKFREFFTIESLSFFFSQISEYCLILLEWIFNFVMLLSPIPQMLGVYIAMIPFYLVARYLRLVN